MKIPGEKSAENRAKYAENDVPDETQSRSLDQDAGDPTHNPSNNEKPYELLKSHWIHHVALLLFETIRTKDLSPF